MNPEVGVYPRRVQREIDVGPMAFLASRGMYEPPSICN